MLPFCFCHKQHLEPLYTPHKKWSNADLHHSCSPIQVKRVPTWCKMTIQYKMLRSNLMVSEPSELNIVYTVVQCTDHHMGKSVTKNASCNNSLKGCIQKECCNKKFTSHWLFSVQRHLSYTCIIHAMIRFEESPSKSITIRPPIDKNVMSTTDIIIYTISIITFMFFENRALWLARSVASSHYNHRAVIITLKASSFPPSKWQPDLLMFRSRKLINNSIFSNTHQINVIILK